MNKIAWWVTSVFIALAVGFGIGVSTGGANSSTAQDTTITQIVTATPTIAPHEDMGTAKWLQGIAAKVAAKWGCTECTPTIEWDPNGYTVDYTVPSQSEVSNTTLDNLMFTLDHVVWSEIHFYPMKWLTVDMVAADIMSNPNDWMASCSIKQQDVTNITNASDMAALCSTPPPPYATATP